MRAGRWLACVWVIGACGAGAAPSLAKGHCDVVPTGIATDDLSLPFVVPSGLMPDPRFDGRAAQVTLHRVRPVYAHGMCAGMPSLAAVFVHGRVVDGPATFDLRATDPVTGADLSIQRALARAGIDTFAPSLLGYGRSTRFEDGLDDPGNASLPPYPGDGSPCPYVGCDRTSNAAVNPLDQQGGLLLPDPLAERRAHTSGVRFARPDVWVRDIRQVIDAALALAQPTDGKVTLVGYSAGGQRVGRMLYQDRLLPTAERYLPKLRSVVFVNSIFNLGPTEEPAVVPAPSFPLTLSTSSAATGGYAMAPDRDAACTGHVVPGAPQQMWTQMLEDDPVGAGWGGGLVRTPTFSNYGWNDVIARQLALSPVLIVHGLDDLGAPLDNQANSVAIYNDLPASHKVLVRVDCASHQLPSEGCSGPRCRPARGQKIYGQRRGSVWPGPHATLKSALIEWMYNGTFDANGDGAYIVDASGVAHADPPADDGRGSRPRSFQR